MWGQDVLVCLDAWGSDHRELENTTSLCQGTEVSLSWILLPAGSSAHTEVFLWGRISVGVLRSFSEEGRLSCEFEAVRHLKSKCLHNLPPPLPPLPISLPSTLVEKRNSTVLSHSTAWSLLQLLLLHRVLRLSPTWFHIQNSKYFLSD